MRDGLHRVLKRLRPWAVRLLLYFDGIGCDANDGSAARFRAATKLQKDGKQARRSITSLRRAGRTCRLDRSHMDDAGPDCKMKLVQGPERLGGYADNILVLQRFSRPCAVLVPAGLVFAPLRR
jgi:hypothetical protein